MQKIDGSTININRGDELSFTFSIERDNGSKYTFQVGDIVIFSIYNKGGLNNKAVLYKEIEVQSESQSVQITLTSEETKIGNLINQPIDYWYEIELNGKYTTIGYDEAGAKIFRLYPEGSKLV